MFSVVTHVAAPETGGNLAMCVPYVKVAEGDESNDWIGTFAVWPQFLALDLRAPVFRVGEVLILDDDGRDQFGRKPGKWDVVVEDFKSAEAAAARVRELTAVEA